MVLVACLPPELLSLCGKSGGLARINWPTADLSNWILKRFIFVLDQRYSARRDFRRSVTLDTITMSLVSTNCPKSFVVFASF